jgi:hypothetical protein
VSGHICVRIAGFNKARKLSGHKCVRTAVFYQARRLSGRICVRTVVVYQARRGFIKCVVHVSDISFISSKHFTFNKLAKE